MDRLWRPWQLATWFSWPHSTSILLLAAHKGYCVRSSTAYPLPVLGLRTRNVWTALAHKHDKCRAANGALTEGLGTGKCRPRLWSSPILSKHSFNTVPLTGQANLQQNLPCFAPVVCVSTSSFLTSKLLQKSNFDTWHSNSHRSCSVPKLPLV